MGAEKESGRHVYAAAISGQGHRGAGSRSGWRADDYWLGPAVCSPQRYGLKRETAMQRRRITSVEIAEGILKIGNQAFADCESLLPGNASGKHCRNRV